MSEEAESPATPKPPISSGQYAAIAVLGIVAVGMFGAVFTLLTSNGGMDVDATLRLAYEEFNSERFANAKGVAESIEPSPDWTDAQRKQHSFVLGASATSMALEETKPNKRRMQASDAIPLLREAMERGFPEGYENLGYELLGSAQYVIGDFSSAANELDTCLKSSIANSRKLLPLLAKAQLRSEQHTASAALKTVERYLALPTIGEDERARGHLLRAEVLAAQKQWDLALADVAMASKYPELESEAPLAIAKVKLAQAAKIVDRQRDADGTIPEAAKSLIDSVLQDCVEIARVSDELTSLDATFVAGQAKRLAGLDEHALGLFASVRQNRTDPAVAIAAGIEELEVLSKSFPTQDTLITAIYMVREIGSSKNFDPRWLSLKEFRKRLSIVVSQLQQRSEFQAAIDLSKSLLPVFEEADALRMEASSYAAWAEQISAAGRGTAEEIIKSRAFHRAAGNAFAKAAELRFVDAEYPAYLWDAIQQYDRAHLYADSLRLLDPYLQYEQRDRAPRGIILQGKALMTLGRHVEALKAFETCITEFPRDSLKYDARVVAAKSAAEIGRVAQARELLEENLHDDLLEPSSAVWRDSLFTLSEILFNEAATNHFALITPAPDKAQLDVNDLGDQFQQNQTLWEEAIRRLEEATLRYGDHRRSRRVSYLAAQAHRYAAKWPELKGGDPDTLEAMRRELNAQRISHLLAAANRYRQLHDELNSVRGDEKLNNHEEIMLRNCYLGEGDALFDKGDFEEAITAYSAAINRFINEPIALEAMVQQSRCFELMGRGDDVERVLKQAIQILGRIPEQHDEMFVKTTRYSRAQWSDFLTWLSQT